MCVLVLGFLRMLVIEKIKLSAHGFTHQDPDASRRDLRNLEAWINPDHGYIQSRSRCNLVVPKGI